MRQFHTAVVERREAFRGAFETQPFEAAWAREAIYFLRIEESTGNGPLRIQAQISVDGTRWLDEGTSLQMPGEAGDSFMRLRHFGGWLRLRGEIEGDAEVILTVHLVLKE